MVKIRKNDISEKDIISYIKVNEIHIKEKKERSEKFNKSMSHTLSALMMIAYMAIYALVFLLAQVGLLAFIKTNPELALSPIGFSIGLWVLYGMLVLFLSSLFGRDKK
jgi:polyferredoxin